MRLGYTGPRVVPDEVVPNVRAFVLNNATGSDGDEHTSGACVGFDALAANALLDEYPTAIHRLIVPADLRQVDWPTIERFKRLNAINPERFIIEYMPEGTKYRDRNNRILDFADELVAAPAFPEKHGASRRSGTWMTIRLARKRGIPDRKLELWTL